MQAGEKYLINLVRKTALLAAVVTCVGAFIMYCFGQQAAQLSYIAGFVCVFMLCLFGFIQFNAYNKNNGILLMLGVTLAILLPTTFSGGVNSRFSVLIPILPIIMCLILPRRLAVGLTLLILLYVFGLTFFNEYIPDYTNLARLQQEQFAKTLWLIMAALLGLAFGLVFVDVNSKLNIQLQASELKNSKEGICNKEDILAYAEHILLKYATNKVSGQHLCLAIVELKHIYSGQAADLLKDPPTDPIKDMTQAGKLIQRIIRQDTDLIGHYEEHQFLVCMQSKNKSQFDKICSKIAIAIEDNYLGVIAHIGFIAVDKNVSVDVNSLLSVAQIALRRSYKHGENHITNYDDMRRT